MAEAHTPTSIKTPQRILYGGVDFRAEERETINRVLDRNWWELAEEAAAFEQELAAAQGVQHAVFVTSRSAALKLGIDATRLPAGSEVIVPACTFPTYGHRPRATWLPTSPISLAPASLKLPLPPLPSTLQ